jgi:Flp pilus assembly protein TadD
MPIRSRLGERTPAQARTLDATTFEVADDSARDLADAMAHKAARLLEKGRREEAAACLRSGLQRSPEHPACMAYYALALADNDARLAEAERLVRGIATANADDARIHDALGRILLERARRKRAFRHFAHARRLGETDPALQRGLVRLDPRRPPDLAFLPRDHFLNVWLGKLRARFRPAGG